MSSVRSRKHRAPTPNAIPQHKRSAIVVTVCTSPVIATDELYSWARFGMSETRLTVQHMSGCIHVLLLAAAYWIISCVGSRALAL